ncbi:FecR family protein [Magnetofaba australis]|nr:FecR domain-containing protein [Magnetofaba australis]
MFALKSASQSLLRTLIAAVVMIGFASISQAADPIGNIKKFEGDAKIVRSGQDVALNLGDPIYVDDLLTTGDGGSIGVTFQDNTMISIGPATEFVVDRFVFQPRHNRLAFGSKITKGTLQFISGTIAKLAPEKVAVNTPTGTIGVRGTRFLVKVE